ncbi:asparagine synthase (glutamine-hydrolyzing) [Maridesulfovibrio sp.]|uniref:asparagine synthase (glutamine-hydrolyzing) n=1 Tax=Maridesulfovibrio sp. TaxID=2795000 RepID=UPI002A18BB39|nr:asparagine synthase (glutamine-hydrolyzing) [Maridesulfovibrio sp.]
MCGICGIIDYSGGSSVDDLVAVKRMTAALYHRGPNNQNIWGQGPASLGHSRLSILDLSSAANQPMRSYDGRYVIVFNGEIYNFRKLRSSLEATGYSFHTDSDTEVLLQMYVAFGPKCVNMLSGMFAFAVWDSGAQTLFAARDRFGQKPLFFSHEGERLSFSSELNSLFEDRTLTREPDLNAVYHYLTVQSVPAPLCAFKGINKLGPGECFFLESGSMKKWRYWTPVFSNRFSGSDLEAAEELDLLLQNAVSTHLESEVPLGLFLSGGVDSSLITAIACRNHGDMRSFSMGFDDQEYDERPFADEIARIYETKHHSEVVSPKIKYLLPAIVRQYGEPYADSSAVPTWMLADITAKHVTVVLSGDGGDDLFGGYERFLNPFIYGDVVKDNPHLLAFMDELKHNLRNRCTDEVLKAWDIDAGTAKYYYHWARVCGEAKKRICSQELIAAATPPLSLCLMLKHFSTNISNAPLDRIQLFELDYYLASTLMPKIDIASMASSLEVRSPFLDNDVADFALSLPTRFRIRRTKVDNCGSFSVGFEPKWLVKELARKYLPSNLVYRRKKGFGAPIAKWLRQDLLELLADSLLSKSARERAWVNTSIVEKMINDHSSGKGRHGNVLWGLLMLELWAQEFL